MKNNRISNFIKYKELFQKPHLNRSINFTNLSEVKRLIAFYKFQHGEKHQSFLDSFKNEINQIFEKQAAIRPISNDVALVQKGVDESANQLEEDVKVLIIKLTAEIARQKKLNHDKEYLGLLKEIQKNCDGLLKKLAQREDYSRTRMLTDSLHKLSNAMGISSLCFSQGEDPLIGEGKFLGACLGFVLNWAKEIHRKEANQKLSKPPVLSGSVYKHQKHTASYDGVQMQPAILSNQKGIIYFNDVDQLLNDIKANQDYVYLLSLNIGFGNGHAVGLRSYQSDNQSFVELFDPNFGIFIFETDDQFKDFLTIWKAWYGLTNTTLNYANLYAICKQKENVQSVAHGLIKQSNPAYFNNIDNFKSILNTFETLSPKISMKDRKAHCLSALKLFISKVTDPHVLTTILTDFNESNCFLLKKRHAFFDSLFKSKKNSHWEETDSGLTIKKLIEARKTELESENRNTLRL